MPGETDASVSIKCPSCGKGYRIPASKLGQRAKCKACGEMIDFKAAQTSAAKPRKADPFAASSGDMSLNDLAALAPSEAVEPIAAPEMPGTGFSFNPAAKQKSASSRKGLGGSLTAMWQALVTRRVSVDGQVPITRKISMAGVFLVIGAILLLAFGSLEHNPVELEEARSIMRGTSFMDRNSKIPKDLPTELIALCSFLAGAVLIGHRMWSAREEKEAPIVLVAFYGVLGVLVVGSLLMMGGGPELAGDIAMLGGIGTLLAAVAFGLWTLYKLSEEGDGTGILCIFAPAVLLPVTSLVMLLTNVPSEHFDKIPWGEVLLALFIMFCVMVLAGGAMAFLMVVLLPLSMAGHIDRGLLGINFSGGSIVALICMLCYIFLVVTRWRLMIKPVGWQMIIFVVGAMLIGSFQLYANDGELIARAERKKERDDEKITAEMIQLNQISPGVTASFRPFPNSRLVPDTVDLDDVVYLSDGRYLIDPPRLEDRQAARDQKRREREEREQDRPRTEPPKPIFKAWELPAASEVILKEGEAWPTFEPPAVDMALSQEALHWGYGIKLLPDYKVQLVINAPERDGERKILIKGPDINGQSVRMELLFVPQAQLDDGRVAVFDWGQMLSQNEVKLGETFLQYGQINGMQFVRSEPAANGRYRSRERVVYAAKMPLARRRVVAKITAYEGTEEQMLACEAMLRTLRRVPPSEITRAQDPATYENKLARLTPELIESVDWDIAGNFAYLDDAGYSHRIMTNGGKGIGLNLNGSNGMIRISMTPAAEGEPRGLMVQRDGPSMFPDPSDTQKGRRVFAYGKDASFVRLWNDELFARIDRGQSQITSQGTYEQVDYYGWMGDYWTSIKLIRRPNAAEPMSEVEAFMSRMRLASPVEVGEDFASRGWIPRMMRDESANLPIAGGTIRQAFVVDALGNMTLSGAVDPEFGKVVGVFPPLKPEQLEPFEQWTVDENVERFLADAVRVGQVEIQPLVDLRASSKNNDVQSEWFARTDAGRVSVTLKIEKLASGEEPLALPVKLDPGSGRATLHLGRRVIRPESPPTVSYREARGLRAWRILMPQVAGASLRRCYYVVSTPTANIVVAANFDRSQDVQLRAIDASVASMVNRAAEVE